MITQLPVTVAFLVDAFLAPFLVPVSAASAYALYLLLPELIHTLTCILSPRR